MKRLCNLTASASLPYGWVIPPRRNSRGDALGIVYHKENDYQGVVITDHHRCHLLGLTQICYGYDRSTDQVADFLTKIMYHPHLQWDLMVDSTNQQMQIIPHLSAAGKEGIINCSTQHAEIFGQQEIVEQALNLPKEVQASFTGSTITVERVDTPLTVYRIGNGIGSYWSTVPPEGPFQFTLDCAMHPNLYPEKHGPNWHPSNGIVMKYEIPPGTIIYRGSAAPQEGHHGFQGGMEQIYIPSNIPEKDVVRMSWQEYQQWRTETAEFQNQVQKSSESVFTQTLQADKLVETYNTNHPQKPVPPHGANSASIGGVASQVGLIPGGLSDHPRHFFAVQTADGKPPCSEPVLKQLIKDVTSTLYVQDISAFVSIHFNEDHTLRVLMPHALRKNSVGRVIEKLDWLLKAMLNGSAFSDDYLRSQQNNPSSQSIHDTAHVIDLKQYCLTHLHTDEYVSLHELMQINGITRVDRVKQSDGETGYKAKFNASFRIIFNGDIHQSGRVFVINPDDFEVKYTIEPEAEYAQYLEEHRLQHGCDPDDWKTLNKVYQTMADLIKKIMPKLPMCRDEFYMLAIIHTLSCYYKTLREQGKAPCLPPMQNDVEMSSPYLLPPLPVRHITEKTYQIKLQDLLKTLSPQSQKDLSTYTSQRIDDRSATLDDSVKDELARIVNTKIMQDFGEPMAVKLSFESIIKPYIESLVSKIKSADPRQAIRETLRKANEMLLSSTLDKEQQSIQLKKIEQELNKRVQKFIKDPLANSELFEDFNLVFNKIGSVLKFPDEKSESYTPPGVTLYGGCGLRLAQVSTVHSPLAQALDDQITNPLGHEIELFKEIPADDGTTSWVFSLSNQPYVGDYHWLEQTSTSQAHDPQERSLVYHAVLESPTALERVLQKGTSPWGVDAHGQLPLHLAAYYGLNPQIRILLAVMQKTGRRGFDSHSLKSCVNQPMHNGATPLQLAAMQGHSSTVKLLTEEYKAEVNKPIFSGTTPLCSAIHHKHSACALELLCCPAINLKTGFPLHTAAELGLSTVVQELLNNGVDVNSPRKDTKTALHLAVAERQLDVVDALLKSKAIDVNIPLASGSTALHIAAENGELVCIEKLLFVKADPNAKNSMRETPLMRAIVNGHINTAKFLFSVTTNRQQENIQGNTAYHLAMQRGLFDLMTDWDFSEDLMLATDSFGRDLFHYLVIHGQPFKLQYFFGLLSEDKKSKLIEHSGLLQLAMQHGQVSVVARLGQVLGFSEQKTNATALYAARFGDLAWLRKNIKTMVAADKENLAHWAAQSGQLQTLKWLLKNSDFTINDVGHLLLAATASGQPPVLECVFKYAISKSMIDINTIKDDGGNTCLHLAAGYGNPELLFLLSTCGANFTQRNRQGHTVFHIAAIREHKEVWTYLLHKQTNQPLPEDLLYFLAKMARDTWFDEVLSHSPQQIHYRVAEEGDNVLHAAVTGGQTQIVQSLMHFPNLCIQKNQQGDTPLMHAIRMDALACVEIILPHTPDAPIPDLLSMAVQESPAIHSARFLKRQLTNYPVDDKAMDLPRWLNHKTLVADLTAYLNALKTNKIKLGMSIAKRLPKIYYPMDQTLCAMIPGLLPGDYSLLDLAIALNKSDWIECLVNDGHPVDKANPRYGVTPLHRLACHGNSLHLRDLFTQSKTVINFGVLEKLGHNIAHTAVVYGQIDVLDLLRHHQQTILLATTGCGENLAHLAAARGHVSILKWLIQHGMTFMLDAMDDQQQTPLSCAIMNEHQSVVEWLLNQVAYIDLHRRVGVLAQSYLSLAIKNKNLAIANLLLTSGVHPNVADRRGQRPIHLAARLGLTSMVTLLAARISNINETDHRGCSVVHCAVYAKDPHLLKWLLEIGADPLIATNTGSNYWEEDGLTDGIYPIHLAANLGDINKFNLLWQADENTPVDDSLSSHAVMGGNLEIIKTCQQSSADPVAATRQMWLTAGGANSTLLPHLISPQFDPNMDLGGGLTPMHIACCSGNPQMVLFLLQHGAVPWVVAKTGKTPLDLAIEYNHPIVVRILLPSVDLTASTVSYRLLVSAIESKNTETVNMLLVHIKQSQLNRCDNEERSLLHLAARQHPAVIPHLLAVGVDPTMKDLSRQTADKVDGLETNMAALIRQYQSAKLDHCQHPRSHLAIRFQNKIGFEWLIAHDGNAFNVVDSEGNSIVHLAVQQPTTFWVLDVLAKLSILVGFTQKNHQQLTPLLLAIEHLSIEELSLLVRKYHLDLSTVDSNGMTALEYCYEHSRMNQFKWLLHNIALTSSSQNQSTHANRKYLSWPSDLIFSHTMTENEKHHFFQWLCQGFNIDVPEHSAKLCQKAVAQDNTDLWLFCRDWLGLAAEMRRIIETKALLSEAAEHHSKKIIPWLLQYCRAETFAPRNGRNPLILLLDRKLLPEKSEMVPQQLFNEEQLISVIKGRYSTALSALLSRGVRLSHSDPDLWRRWIHLNSTIWPVVIKFMEENCQKDDSFTVMLSDLCTVCVSEIEEGRLSSSIALLKYPTVFSRLAPALKEARSKNGLCVMTLVITDPLPFQAPERSILVSEFKRLGFQLANDQFSLLIKSNDFYSILELLKAGLRIENISDWNLLHDRKSTPWHSIIKFIETKADDASIIPMLHSLCISALSKNIRVIIKLIENPQISEILEEFLSELQDKDGYSVTALIAKEKYRPRVSSGGEFWSINSRPSGDRLPRPTNEDLACAIRQQDLPLIESLLAAGSCLDAATEADIWKYLSDPNYADVLNALLSRTSSQKSLDIMQDQLFQQLEEANHHSQSLEMKSSSENDRDVPRENYDPQYYLLKQFSAYPKMVDSIEKRIARRQYSSFIEYVRIHVQIVDAELSRLTKSIDIEVCKTTIINVLNIIIGNFKNLNPNNKNIVHQLLTDALFGKLCFRFDVRRLIPDILFLKFQANGLSPLDESLADTMNSLVSTCFDLIPLEWINSSRYSKTFLSWLFHKFNAKEQPSSQPIKFDLNKRLWTVQTLLASTPTAMPFKIILLRMAIHCGFKDIFDDFIKQVSTDELNIDYDVGTTLHFCLGEEQSFRGRHPNDPRDPRHFFECLLTIGANPYLMNGKGQSVFDEARDVEVIGNRRTYSDILIKFNPLFAVDCTLKIKTLNSMVDQLKKMMEGFNNPILSLYFIKLYLEGKVSKYLSSGLGNMKIREKIREKIFKIEKMIVNFGLGGSFQEMFERSQITLAIPITSEEIFDEKSSIEEVIVPYLKFSSNSQGFFSISGGIPNREDIFHQEPEAAAVPAIRSH